MTEIWKDIPNYEGLYQASNFGRVKSLSRTAKHPSGKTREIKELILSPYSKSNYLRVALCKNGKPKTFLIHRLIAFAFIDNPLNKLTVNHKNGNRYDNRLENLEWTTQSENNKHAFKLGLNIPYDRNGKNNPNYKHGKRMGLVRKKKKQTLTKH